MSGQHYWPTFPTKTLDHPIANQCSLLHSMEFDEHSSSHCRTLVTYLDIKGTKGQLQNKKNASESPTSSFQSRVKSFFWQNDLKMTWKMHESHTHFSSCIRPWMWPSTSGSVSHRQMTEQRRINASLLLFILREALNTSSAFWDASLQGKHSLLRCKCVFFAYQHISLPTTLFVRLLACRLEFTSEHHQDILCLWRNLRQRSTPKPAW